MTSRNLNQTWRDVVFAQYDSDHAADVPFPVRYLIQASPWQRDIFILIPRKISPRELRHAVGAFYAARRHDEPVFDGPLISVWPRKGALQAQSLDTATTE